MRTTAKVVLNSKHESGTGEHRQVVAAFSANYANGANAEWAIYTPSAQLNMTLKGEVADRFVIGQEYTLTFEPTAL
jgi:hypothetical protein